MLLINWKKTLSMISLLLLSTVIASANNALLLQRLDSVIEVSEKIVAVKNKKIEMLKQLAAKEKNDKLLLKIYADLIRKGVKKIDDVPAKLKNDVIQILNDWGIATEGDD